MTEEVINMIIYLIDAARNNKEWEYFNNKQKRQWILENFLEGFGNE